MINFFRKIRKQLADDNKPLKYMRYAIGEIVLVMVGILLALQVNNWNEQIKFKKNVATILEELKQDLISDIHYLEDLESVYSNWEIQADDILKALREKSNHQINELSEYMVGRGSMNNLSIRTATFDQLKNSGLLYNIKAKTITQEINQYYEFAKIEIEKVNSDNQELYRYVLNTSGYDYINTIARLEDKVNLEYMDWLWLEDPKSTQYRIFEARVSFHKEAIRVNKFLIRQLIGKAKNVIKAIDVHYSENEKTK